MRDIWYRRLLPALAILGAAIFAFRLRLRPARPARTVQPDRFVAAIPSQSATPMTSQPGMPAPDLLIPSAQPMPPVMKQISVGLYNASLWFGSAIGLCLIAAFVVNSAQQVAFHDLAPFLLVAAGGLAIGWGVAGRWLNRDATRAWPKWLWRFSLLFAALIVSFIAADVNFNASEYDRAGQLGSTVLWVVAIIIAMAAAWQRVEPAAVKPSQPITRIEVVVLLAIIALTFALRVSNLEHIPSLLLGDETKYAVAARSLYEDQQIKPFTTGSDGHWNFYLQIIGLFLQLFGPTITAIRMPSVLAGTLSVVATYAVVRQLWGPRPALIAAALLAAFAHHIQFSRVGFNSIDDPLFSMLVFGCVWLAWRTGRRRAWLMAALAAGLSQYFFVGGRLVLIQLIALAVFWLIMERRRVREQALNIALAVGVFICIVAPIMYFIVIRPDDYMGSLNTKNIYRSGWLTAQMQATNETEVDVLWGQLRDVITSFSFGSDEGFYWAMPILSPLMTILVVIALGYFVAHLREGPYFWIVSAFALLVTFGGILMVSPTAGSHRLLGSGPLLYTAVAVMLDRAWHWFENRWRRPVLVAVGGTVAIGLLMFADARVYFVDYLTQKEPHSPEAILNLVQRYVIDIGPRTDPRPVQIICVGLNADFCRGTNIDLLARPLLARADVVTDVPTIANVPPPDQRPQFVIINASLTQEVNQARARYPYVLSRNLVDAQDNVDFVAFEIPGQQP